nr:uncharacterized protein DKFZp434B061-like [Aegilops tauschii subsp. strangulata]
MGSKAAPSRRLRHRSVAIARPRIRVSPGAIRRAMRAAVTPSRRERALPPPVRPKIEQVFTTANAHRLQTPHPGNHAARTAMVTRQHRATGSAQEHRATTTRATAPASKTLTPPHSRPAATPTKETSGKAPHFAPLGSSQRRDPIGQSKLASIDPSCSTGRETSSWSPAPAEHSSRPCRRQVQTRPGRTWPADSKVATTRGAGQRRPRPCLHARQTQAQPPPEAEPQALAPDPIHLDHDEEPRAAPDAHNPFTWPPAARASAASYCHRAATPRARVAPPPDSDSLRHQEPSRGRINAPPPSMLAGLCPSARAWPRREGEKGKERPLADG